MIKLNFPTNWIDTNREAYERDQQEKDRTPLTEKADPLALSWASFGAWLKGRGRWIPFNDVDAAPHDHDMAEKTRHYYRDKLAMAALKSGGESSQFRRDLYEICNGGIMRGCHRGMLYRLPYFYVEDTEYEALINATPAQPSLHIPPQTHESVTRTLIPCKRIFHSRRNREIMEYWFHDQDTGYAVKWPVLYDNPLRSVVDHLHKSQPRLVVNALWNLGHDRRMGFMHWYVVKPELRFG